MPNVLTSPYCHRCDSHGQFATPSKIRRLPKCKALAPVASFFTGSCFWLVASGRALLLQVLSDPFRPVADNIYNMWYTQGPLMIVMVFLLPVFVVDTIKISHRFAGPVISLRRTMREIADGQPPRKLQFRKHDFWHDLADDYNAMIADWLNGGITNSIRRSSGSPSRSVSSTELALSSSTMQFDVINTCERSRQPTAD